MGLGLVAAHKIRYCVRHFGGVFTFQQPSAEISFFMVMGRLLGARSAIFSRILTVLAPGNPKFSPPAGASGSGLAPSSLILGNSTSRISHLLNRVSGTFSCPVTCSGPF